MMMARFSTVMRSRSVLLAAVALTNLWGASTAWAGGPAPKPTTNGNLSDFKAAIAAINGGGVNAAGVNMVDNIGNGANQGTQGFDDEPIQDDATPQSRFMHSPINVGDFFFIYSPDSDGVIFPPAQDDSWLAVAANIANGDGDVCVDNPGTPVDECAGFSATKLTQHPDLPCNIMVPFDTDGNGNPCVLGTGANSRWCESMTGCSPYNPSLPCPQPVLTFDEANDAVNLAFFLCATSVGDLSGPDVSLILQQQGQGPVSLVTDPPGLANIQSMPAVGDTCAVITARGLDNNKAFPDGLGNDDIEIIINRIDSQVNALFPGEDYRAVTRFRLANLGMTLRSDASGDLSNEDSMFALISLPINEIEVKKQIRCPGQTSFSDFVDVPPGGVAEFRIEVENTGNSDLVVELEDLLSGAITPNLGTMVVTLFRPSNNPVGTVINFGNAGVQNPPFNPAFFGPANNQFLIDMQSGVRRCLGVLQGVDVCSDPFNPQLGDRVVITFTGTVNSTGNFCNTTIDFTNTILACGDPDVGVGPCSTNPNSGNEIYDRPNMVDTPRESASGADDNVVRGNVFCIDSSLDCDKLINVDFGNDGSTELLNRTSVLLDTDTLPTKLTYSFRIQNTGDIPVTNLCVVDSGLVAAAVAAGIPIGACGLNMNATCTGAGNAGALIANLAAGATATISCEIIIQTEEQFEMLAASDGGAGGASCFENTAFARGTAMTSSACGNFSQQVQSSLCGAVVCLQEPPRECVPTKAKFDIWNENEVRFSGTERCIYSWDQEYLSQYTGLGLANHFHRWALQTNKGKARIDGLRSPVVCGNESIPAPFLGVAARLLDFNYQHAQAGTTLVGIGQEQGQILYTLPNPGGEEATLPPWMEGGRVANELLPSFPGLNPFGGPQRRDVETSTFGSTVDPRVDVTTKGSILVYPKVELKWDASNTLIQDTFLTIVNDFSDSGVRVQLYFVNGDLPALPVLQGDPPMEVERGHLGCNWQDNVIILTNDESAYWSTFSGLPKGVSPFTNLDPGIPPGRPDTDPYNLGGRVLRGYVLAWAVELGTSREIRWNHLSGTAILVNYRDTTAWEYNAWAFQALHDVNNGDLLLPPHGQLDLNGVEYEFAPSQLVFDFYSVGATLSTGGPWSILVRDTHLTLWAALKDLRDP